MKDRLPLIARNRSKLKETLTNKQKDILKKFGDCTNEMQSVIERDTFSYGFRLGVRLIADAFLLPLRDTNNNSKISHLHGLKITPL